ncbi:hypothetical protein OG948_27560 [Embleya sp. NBC_00888]|uniref:hypothetical protein n=1 Tax=Embleya sp. NBC_00888 TaxID=2975960 RepID=UPI003863CA5A|nr:hypothetical protein OG948_27560 [Embleya sp. NBC_00888]
MRRNRARTLRISAVAAVCISLGALTACGTAESPLSTIEKTSPTEPVTEPAGSGLDENVRNEDLDVGELARRAKQSASGLKTVHVVADIVSDGKAMRLDLRVDRGSEDFQGTIQQNDVRLDVRRVGSDMYVKGDERAYRSLVGTVDGELAAKLLAGKWLKGDVNSEKLRGVRSITTVADPGAALKNFPEDGVKLPIETIDDRRMIPLTGPPGSNNGKVYIEAQGGKPYPVLIVSKGASNSGSISYGDFDVPVKVTVPPAADVIEIPDRTSSSSTPRPGSTA